MNEESMSQALNAIHEIAENILSGKYQTDEITKKVELILSIARYKSDVRSESEISD